MIVVCGEALIDLVARGDGLYEARAGGAPANVAVTLARLGAPAAYLGGLSTDHFGGQLRAHLGDAGVDLTNSTLSPLPTCLAVADTSRAEVTYTFYAEGTATFSAVAPPAGQPEAIYVGGLGTVVEPMAGALLDVVSQLDPGPVRVYDPNVRPAVVAGGRADYRDRVERWVGLADVVKVSAGDLGYLYPGAGPEAVAAEWLGRGPALVAVTLGAEGAAALGAAGSARAEAEPVAVSDAIGAGDAFSAGLLHSLSVAGDLDRQRLRSLGHDALGAHLRRAGRVAADHLRATAGR